jgi:hypothetical protein
MHDASANREEALAAQVTAFVGRSAAPNDLPNAMGIAANSAA